MSADAALNSSTGSSGPKPPLPNGDHFVETVEAIYHCAVAPSHWPTALQAIADCFGDVGTVLIWRRDDGSFGTIVSPTLTAAQEDYAKKWWPHDIRAARSHDHGFRVMGGAITDRHIASREEIDAHPIYRDFLASHGLKWFAAVQVSPEPRISVAISVQRALDRPEFSDDDLATLTRLGRHAEDALRLSIRLINADLTSMGVADALSRIGVGVFVLDRLGRVVFRNPIADVLVGDGLEVVNGSLTTRFGEEREQLREALAAVREHTVDPTRDARPILIQRTRSLRPLAIYVLPVPSSLLSIAEEFLASANAIVLAVDGRRDEMPDPARVRDVLGVTLGEARVASLVGAGLRPREAAERLGITEQTARTVLKRVLGKVGVSRQSELSALMTRLLLW